MSAYIALEPILGDILHAIQPVRDDWAVRMSIINEFRAVVQSVETLAGATVEPFGSYVSNLYTRWGDLDISIELQNGTYISSAGKKRQQNLLEDILKALRMAGGWRRLQFIANARVPILKFESKYQSISCDVSISNLKGVLKSKFLYWISGIDGRFRELVLLVKEWARAHAINNSKAGSLNSFSYTLLVIFHLQTCEPAILPPLKEIYPGNVVDDLSGVRSAAERHIEEVCATNIARFMSDRRRPINRSSLSELFISFFAKFSDIAPRASYHGICTFTGQWGDIMTNMRWQPKTYAIFIEDPFEQPANTARAVSAKQLIKISEAFGLTYGELVSASRNQNSVITTLARPRLLRSISRQPLQSPSISRVSLSTSQVQAYRPTNDAQLQSSFQNMSLGYPPRVETRQRTMNGRGQQRCQFRNISRASGPSANPIQTSMRTHQLQREVWKPKSDKNTS